MSVQLLLAAQAGAGNLTGGFSPTIIAGGADLNGDGAVNASDDANRFYGDTSIINGMLDCDAWGPNANDGSEGDGVINGADDCSLVGYDGTPDGVTIDVDGGVFLVANGPLPTVFNSDEPNNPDVGDSDFAWSAIDGRVDSNGDEEIDADDCHVGVVGALIVLGHQASNPNPCGLAPVPNSADNGLVDFNDDSNITGIDSCSNGCFFGHDVVAGKVQEIECPGFEGDPRSDVIGTSGADVLTGTKGGNVICGFGGSDVLRGLAGADSLVGGRGADVLRGNRGNDDLLGGLGPDRLLGGRGNDFLAGGRGVDTCRGGPGRDITISC